RAPGRLRRRFRGAPRRAAAGAAVPRTSAGGIPDPAVRRCPVACAARSGAATTRAEAQVGPAAGAAPAGRPLARTLARRGGLRLWAEAAGAVGGGLVPGAR